jgi:hypothetical protein
MRFFCHRVSLLTFQHFSSETGLFVHLGATSLSVQFTQPHNKIISIRSSNPKDTRNALTLNYGTGIISRRFGHSVYKLYKCRSSTDFIYNIQYIYIYIYMRARACVCVMRICINLIK